MPTVTVNIAETHAAKPFSAFKIGDFVIARATGKFGIKVDETAIFWFEQNWDGRRAVCSTVPADKLYESPTAVHIDVTR